MDPAAPFEFLVGGDDDDDTPDDSSNEYEDEYENLTPAER